MTFGLNLSLRISDSAAARCSRAGEGSHWLLNPTSASILWSEWAGRCGSQTRDHFSRSRGAGRAECIIIGEVWWHHLLWTSSRPVDDTLAVTSRVSNCLFTIIISRLSQQPVGVNYFIKVKNGTRSSWALSSFLVLEKNLSIPHLFPAAVGSYAGCGGDSPVAAYDWFH